MKRPPSPPGRRSKEDDLRAALLGSPGPAPDSLEPDSLGPDSLGPDSPPAPEGLEPDSSRRESPTPDDLPQGGLRRDGLRQDGLRQDGQHETIRGAQHPNPHAWLGPHPVRVGDETGTVVRLFHPEALAADIVLPADDSGGTNSTTSYATTALGGGLFAAWLPGVDIPDDGPLDYRAQFRFVDGSAWQRDDPYRFAPTVGDFDLYLLAEGTHRRPWDCLGGRPVTHQGVDGFAFSVWAPNARRVSVVGSFCHWDGRLFAMRRLGTSGVFELFIPGLGEGEVYKFEILGPNGERILKADPVGRWCETPPATASRTFRSSYTWGDDAWRAAAPGRDITREPLAIYEVHLGSWLRRGEVGPDDPMAEATGEPIDDGAGGAAEDFLSYRELAPRLVAHVQSLGFNAIELLPVAEHPYSGSWGYQVTGYFAPTARFGDPDDFRFFVDHCHQHGIAVIIDWVPAHFVKDAHGLGRFDGTALYEHEDPRRGEHPDWGTYIFNFGRWEVRSFLLGSALYWLDAFHIDGLRVDAVASMLYLDYSREEGQWIPNAHGGRENLDAIEVLQQVNRAVAEDYPGCFTIAEESTAWPGITKPVDEGGLGFHLKWNMGWMHDTLNYFGVDPLFRSGSHDQLTFAMVYEYSERFLNPLSHDEVVHGKGSLYGKMPGDPWRKLANLRALYAYQLTRPGKVLLFMGSELASQREWTETQGLDWYLLGDPGRAGLFRFLGTLGKLYTSRPALWRADPDPEGFQWVACHDRAASVLVYERRCDPIDVPPTSAASMDLGAEGDPVDFSTEQPRYRHRMVVVLNLTPVPRESYRIGALEPGDYQVVLNSDDQDFGGSGYSTPRDFTTRAIPHDGCRQSLSLTLPPLAALVLEPVEKKAGKTHKTSTTKRASTKKPATKKVSTKKAPAKKTTAKKTVKKASPKKTISKKTTTD